MALETGGILGVAGVVAEFGGPAGIALGVIIVIAGAIPTGYAAWYIAHKHPKHRHRHHR